jgi:hypothetical protein
MKKIYIILLPILLAGCADLMTVGSRTVAPISYTSERPTFEIHSPTNFVASFFTKDLHKTQFETQADYEARLHALQPSGGSVYLQVDSDLVHYVYNAEKQTLVVILPPELITGQDFTSVPLVQQPYSTSRFTIGRWLHSLGTTPMQNAYGAKADVTYMEEKTYEVFVLNFLDLPLNTRWKENADSYTPAGIGLAVPVPGSDAEGIVKSKSVTLILGVTIGDIHAAGHYSVPITPTITNPVGCEDEIYEIPVRITDIKAYNTQTGYVLASWTRPGT